MVSLYFIDFLYTKLDFVVYLALLKKSRLNLADTEFKTFESISIFLRVNSASIALIAWT